MKSSLSVISLMDVSGFVPKKVLPHPRSCRFSLMLPSRSFIVLYLYLGKELDMTEHTRTQSNEVRVGICWVQEGTLQDDHNDNVLYLNRGLRYTNNSTPFTYLKHINT